MSIDEIKVPGSSFCFVAYPTKIENMALIFSNSGRTEEVFDLAREKPGFHNLEYHKDAMRGHFSYVTSFEVENLSDGMVVKTLNKRIDSCEFILIPNILFAWGKPGPMKILARSLTNLSGYGITPFEFEFTQMSQFQDRLTMLKAISLTNPKDREIRRARLAGRIEDYASYSVIDRQNHGIDSVSGLIDSPLGPMTVSVRAKGKITLKVRRGFYLNLECLNWIIKLIRDYKVPAMPTMPSSAFSAL